MNSSALSLGLRIKKVEGCVILMNSNGNELARMRIDDDVDISDVGIYDAFRRRIQQCEGVFKFIGVRKGKGGAKQEAEEFIQKVIDRLRPKVEKLISSTGIDSRILLFVAVRKISNGISVVFENSPGIMQ